MARGRHVGDLGGVEGRKPGLTPDLAGEIEMRRVAHALHRDHVGQAGIRVDVAAHHVQEVDQATVLEPLRDRARAGAATRSNHKPTTGRMTSPRSH